MLSYLPYVISIICLIGILISYIRNSHINKEIARRRIFRLIIEICVFAICMIIELMESEG